MEEDLKHLFLIPLKFRDKPFLELAQLSKIFEVFNLPLYHIAANFARKGWRGAKLLPLPDCGCVGGDGHHWGQRHHGAHSGVCGLCL